MANFKNTLNVKYHDPKDSIIDRHLQTLIEDYESKEEQVLETENMKDQQLLHQIKLNDNSNFDFKRSLKPICMFKDLMGLKKQNIEKKSIIKSLSQVNNGLKRQYNECLKNNKKMEQFLKQIQFTFKNDQSNQKANQILTRAKKTLHREEQQSKNNYKKISKNSKTNYIRQFKYYFQVLEFEKAKLEQLISQGEQEYKMRKFYSDFTLVQEKKYKSSHKKIEQMIENEERMKNSIKRNDKKQIIETGIQLKNKKTVTINGIVQKLTKEITSQLLKKQGYLYEQQILLKKQKGKNKKSEKDESTLKNQIRKMKKRILYLQKELKEKRKTNTYISKWTLELKVKLQERKKQHSILKEQFQHQINQLSREYEDWNRKYKAQLVQEQMTNKKGISNDRLIEKNVPQNIRKIRIVKVQEILHMKKKIIFNLLNQKQKPQDYLSSKILKDKTEVSVQDLLKFLREIPPLQLESQSQIMKLARYIVQDNNNDFTKVDLTTTIQSKLAILIFKHLFKTDLSLENMDEINSKSKQFLNMYFDDIRQQLWKQCGKGITFIPDNLLSVLKRRINEEKKVLEFTEYFEYLIWKDFGEVCTLSLSSFEKVCEKIVGKKLVKDSKIRISKTTIKSFFEKDAVKEILEIQKK